MKKTFLPIILATVWISLSEFLRNEFLLKSYWVDHYESMGLIFPSEPMNGVIWGIWALCFSIVIFIISGKFDFLKTALFSWFLGFVLMWLVVGNLGVLPPGILIYAIPLSILEVIVAILIIRKFSE